MFFSNFGPITSDYSKSSFAGPFKTNMIGRRNWKDQRGQTEKLSVVSESSGEVVVAIFRSLQCRPRPPLPPPWCRRPPRWPCLKRVARWTDGNRSATLVTKLNSDRISTTIGLISITTFGWVLRSTMFFFLLAGFFFMGYRILSILNLNAQKACAEHVLSCYWINSIFLWEFFSLCLPRAFESRRILLKSFFVFWCSLTGIFKIWFLYFYFE